MSQIKITPKLLNNLRQKAKAAGGNQWVIYESSDGIFIADANDREGPHLAEIWWPKEANHITAANPAVVLALVAEVERLRGTQDELAETLSDVLRHTDLSGWKLGEQIEKDATDLLKRIKEANNADPA